jgi:hypothetical protein
MRLGNEMTGGKDILVHLGGGMGDILLATPMIEMLSRGGHEVDLCLQGDTPGVEGLFRGWKHARRVSTDAVDFVSNDYQYYIYGGDVSGSPIAFRNRADAITLHPMWDWHHSHHMYSEVEMYTHLARAIDADLPIVTQPSCTTSDRKFQDITRHTCVLVPGGQRNMIIRKWPKFGELAERLADVAVVGTPPDLDMSNRIVFPGWTRRVFGQKLDYPGRTWRIARNFAERYDVPVTFPPHVKDYIGKLSLEDTAALIAQAGFVVGNDCGISHLAVALGKPVFVLLGPTSRRRVYPEFWPHVRVIARQYGCQPCQEKDRGLNVWRQSMSQCYCPYRLRCMNDIEVDDVMAVLERYFGQSLSRRPAAT